MTTTTNAELIAQFRRGGNEWSGKYGGCSSRPPTLEQARQQEEEA